jgi:hypothetical protein
LNILWWLVVEVVAPLEAVVVVRVDTEVGHWQCNIIKL